ncbi:MAG: LytR C-terminal domain-containing protein [Actinobacteria bacterium]|nr:LytR C-terminal domain-containing protein [Actinomycetota bacterium]
MVGEEGAARDRPVVRSVRSTREGYRRRRAEIRRARRRLLIRRVLLGLLALVAVGGVVFGVVSLGGRSGVGGSNAPDSTSPSAARSAGVVLRVTQDASTAAVLFVSVSGSPTTLMSFPGDTLAQVEAGFATIETIVAEQGPEAIAHVVQHLIDSEVTAVADVSWASLREVATIVSSKGALPPALRNKSTSAASVLTAADVVAAAAKTSKGQAALDSLDLKGSGAKEVAEALRELPSPPGVEAVVPGKWVGQTPSEYYEPDPVRIAVLKGESGGEDRVSVEVQNGSGEIGVAEAVSTAIVGLGFGVLEPKNAEQFPDVVTTQILAAPDVLAEAEHVRTLLGVGMVVKREEFPVGRIVVVVGRDLPVSSVPSTGG